MNTHTETQTMNRTTSTQPTNQRNRVEPPSLSDAAQDALSIFQDYAKDRPDVVAFTCLGIGFILGWKLKPW